MLLLKGELLLPGESNAEPSMQALHPTTSPGVLCSLALDVSYPLSAPDLISHTMGVRTGCPVQLSHPYMTTGKTIALTR